MALLDPVAAHLKEDFPDGKFDPKALGVYVGQLLQFMEDALGLKVSA